MDGKPITSGSFSKNIMAGPILNPAHLEALLRQGGTRICCKGSHKGRRGAKMKIFKNHNFLFLLYQLAN